MWITRYVLGVGCWVFICKWLFTLTVVKTWKSDWVLILKQIKIVYIVIMVQNVEVIWHIPVLWRVLMETPLAPVVSKQFRVVLHVFYFCFGRSPHAEAHEPLRVVGTYRLRNMPVSIPFAHEALGGELVIQTESMSCHLIMRHSSEA